MKKIKVGVWVLFWVAVFVFVSAALFQNYDYLFQSKRTMVLFFKKTPELPTILFYLLTFLTGVIVTGLLALYKFYYINKRIKVYKQDLESQALEIVRLKDEIVALGGNPKPVSAEETSEEKREKGNGATDMNTDADGRKMELSADDNSKNQLIV